jgi:hypothetical protein
LIVAPLELAVAVQCLLKQKPLLAQVEPPLLVGLAVLNMLAAMAQEPVRLVVQAVTQAMVGRVVAPEAVVVVMEQAAVVVVVVPKLAMARPPAVEALEYLDKGVTALAGLQIKVAGAAPVAAMEVMFVLSRYKGRVVLMAAAAAVPALAMIMTEAFRERRLEALAQCELSTPEIIVNFRPLALLTYNNWSNHETFYTSSGRDFG